MRAASPGVIRIIEITLAYITVRTDYFNIKTFCMFKELEDEKHDVSETGSVSVIRCGETLDQ
jgi:hypothetical protein